GYNAALLAHLVGSGQVTALDIDDDLVADARAHLDAAGVCNVEVIGADGGLGYAPRAPYDRIILSVGAWDLSPAWLNQLTVDGVLVVPWWLGARQYSVAFEKHNDHLRSRNTQPCGFMALRGNFAGRSVWRAEEGMVFGGEHVEALPTKQLAAVLAQPPRIEQLARSIHLNDLLDYLAVTRERVFSVARSRAPADYAVAYGIGDAESAALLLTPDPSSAEPSPQVQVYGTSAAWERLQRLAGKFVRDGQPSIARGTIEAHTRGSAAEALLMLHKRWMDYVFRPVYSL
ncbi:MAG: hypothetical protein LC737_03570, partial [Chloroflexi bacterium]|nr:hypothetical protein [Chloroflexota bacterium]